MSELNKALAEARERGKQMVLDLPNVPKDEMIDRLASLIYDASIEYQDGSLMGKATFQELLKFDKDYWRSRAHHLYNLVCWHKGLNP